MRDPVSGPVDFWFFAFALVLLLWIAVDTRRVLEFPFYRAKPLSGGVVVVLKTLAGLCVCGLAIVLIGHLVRPR